MRRHNQLAALALLGFASLCRADPGALSDLAARLDYGFYAAEPSVIRAARAELDQTSKADPWSDYYRAFAALRLAQLSHDPGRETAKLLDECVKLAEGAASHRQAAAESWILVAACSALAAKREVVQSVFHERRFEHALQRAREIDPDNPRIAFLESSAMATARASIAALEATVESFRAWPRRYEPPYWGHAETHVLLGEAYLRHNDARRARDHIEQALLIAPDYWQALEVRRRLRTR